MGTIYRPNPNLSAFGAAPTALDSISKIFDNNQINAQDQVKRNLQNAEIANYQAKVREEQAKFDARAVASQEAQNLAALFAPTLPQPISVDGLTPAVPGQSIQDKLRDPTNLGKINASMINLSLKAGQPSADIANLLRAVTANSGVSDDLIARSAVAAGTKVEPNDAFSIAGQDRIRAGNVTNEIKVNAAKPNSNTYILPPGTNLNDLTAPTGTPASGKTLYDNIANSTGPASAIGSAFANAGGFLGAKVNPDVVQGRQDLETFALRFTNSMRTNAKFSEGERKDLAKRLSVAPSSLTSPEFARQKLISIDNSLADLQRKTADDVRDPYMSKADRQAAEANLRNIREFRMQLGAPQGGDAARGADNKISTPTTPSKSSSDLSAIDAEIEAINQQLGGLQ